jgi:hypothetical protein
MNRVNYIHTTGESWCAYCDFHAMTDHEFVEHFNANHSTATGITLGVPTFYVSYGQQEADPRNFNVGSQFTNPDVEWSASDEYFCALEAAKAIGVGAQFLDALVMQREKRRAMLGLPVRNK